MRPILAPPRLNALKIAAGALSPGSAKGVDCAAVFIHQKAERPDPPFVLLDGPPFANGKVHTGHFLNKTLKDIVLRYQVIRGRRVEYRPGWDCHGLPIELLALKSSPSPALGSPGAGPLDRTVIRQRARAFAEKAMADQKSDFKSWQLLGDFDTHTYNTMSPEFEFNELMVLKRLVDCNLVQRKKMPVNWSPALQTALAESEIEYHDNHTSTAAYISFPCKDSGPFGSGPPVHAVIWTTTPWSIVGNTAIAVHRDLTYVTVATEDARYIVASKLAASFAEQLGVAGFLQHEKSVEVQGKNLLSMQALHPLEGTLRPFIVADHVSDVSGTGLVHIAPAHGVEDWEAMPDSPAPCFVDERGVYRGLPTRMQALDGLKVLSAESSKRVLELLAPRLVLPPKPYVHRYPYDWRTKTPMMTRLASQWFVNATPEQATLADCVERFVPEAGGKRLRAFMQTRKHGWCLSRQRAWGVPIPAFVRCPKPGEKRADGNADEGEESLLTSETVELFANAVAKHGSDVWFSPVANADEDPLLPRHLWNQGWVRAFDTLDVWFDSGSAWSMLGPGNKADLVIEGSDQHRGWFQSSLLTRLDDSPFKTIMTHGFVLDDKAQKMSKSLGNVVTPAEAINRAGSIDALRLWVALSDVGGDVCLSQASLKGAQEALTKLINTQKFLMGSVVANSATQNARFEDLETLDRVILNVLAKLDKDVEASLDALDIRGAARAVMEFVNGEWASLYLDSVKDRLYCEPAESRRRQAALLVLREMFLVLSKAICPIVPNSQESFFAQAPPGLFPELAPNSPSSIMLASWSRRPRDLLLGSSQVADADRVLRIRTQVNRLFEGVKRASNAVGVIITLDRPLHAEWMRVANTKAQWTALEEALGVASAKVEIAGGGGEQRNGGNGGSDEGHQVLVVEKDDAAQDWRRCIRCRRFHSLVTDIQGVDGCLCPRCQ